MSEPINSFIKCFGEKENIKRFIDDFSNGTSELNMSNIIPNEVYGDIENVPEGYLHRSSDGTLFKQEYKWYKDKYGSYGDVDVTLTINEDSFEILTYSDTPYNFFIHCAKEYNLAFTIEVSNFDEDEYCVYYIDSSGDMEKEEYDELSFIKLVSKNPDIEIADYLTSFWDSYEDIKLLFDETTLFTIRGALDLINKTNWKVKSKYRKKVK